MDKDEVGAARVCGHGESTADQNDDSETRDDHPANGGSVPSIKLRLSGVTKSVGLDVGGSLAKIAYLVDTDECSEESTDPLRSTNPQSAGSECHPEHQKNWQLRFAKFEASDIPSCLEFIR